jgi:hypothetical protein
MSDRLLTEAQCKAILAAKQLPEEWRVWIDSLKTGDTVALVDTSRGPTCTVVVRRTPTGKLYVQGYGRLDWSRQHSYEIPGAGRRFLAPVPR